MSMLSVHLQCPKNRRLLQQPSTTQYWLQCFHLPIARNLERKWFKEFSSTQALIRFERFHSTLNVRFYKSQKKKYWYWNSLAPPKVVACSLIPFNMTVPVISMELVPSLTWIVSGYSLVPASKSTTDFILKKCSCCNI